LQQFVAKIGNIYKEMNDKIVHFIVPRTISPLDDTHLQKNRR